MRTTFTPRVARRSPFIFLVVSLAIAGVWMAGVMQASADEPTTLDITVQGTSGGEDDLIDIRSMTYQEASDAFDAADEGSATLPMGPAALPTVSANDAEVHRMEGAEHASIAVLGSTNLLGLPVDMLVTAKWDDTDTDNTADTAVLFSFGGVSLGDITDFDDFPLEMTGAWAGAAPEDVTVDPEDFDGDVAGFFDDGIAGTEDAFEVSSGSVAFRGALDASNTVVGDAAREIGLSGEARIDGTLSTDLGVLDGDGASDVTVGLELAATLPTTNSGNLPEWFEPTESWLLELAVDSGSVAASISGGASITAGERTFDVTASVGISHDETATTFTFEAEMGPQPDLFGQAWLDLEQLALDATISTADGFSGGLNGTFDLEDLTGQAATADIAFTFAAGGDGTEGSFELTTDAQISLSQVAASLDATPDGGMPGELDVTIDGFGLYAAFATGGGEGTSLTLAVTTGINVDINQATLESELLLRLTTGGGNATQFLFGVKPVEGAETTVGQLLDADFGNADITLPRFTLTVSNAEWDIAADDLDTPTQTYLGDGEDLAVDQGVALRAEVTIPQGLIEALEEAGLTVDDDLLLEGKLPVLGSTELSLSIAFPNVSSPPFSDVGLALVFRQDGAQFEIGLEGEATVAVPRTEDPNCSEPYEGACIDDLTFDLSATLSLGGTQGIEITLQGGLTVDDGWEEPFGIQGLTIWELRLQLGVQGTPPGATIGMLGRLTINETDVTVSFLFAVTANPPWVDPLGFTFAASSLEIEDLATLHEQVSGDEISESDLQASLPANLRVEDAFVAFGRSLETDLCIRPGFFLTAELHIGGTAPAGGEAPPCEPPPTSPPEVTQECADSDSCIASILFNIDTGQATGTPKLQASGFFAETDLGPLHFDPVILELELSSETQRLFVSGGARLDDPFDPGDDPETWASGSFTLEIEALYLRFEAEMSLADGRALHVHATGIADLDLADPQFEVELEFRSDVLDDIADEIDRGFNNLAADIEDFANMLAQADSDNPNLWRNMQVLLEEDGDAPQWLLDFVSTMADVEDVMGSINQTFIDAGLPPPVAVKAIQDFALQGLDIEFGGIPGLEIPSRVCVLYNIFTDECIEYVEIGDPVCLGFVQDGECWSVPPASWDIPGLCDDPDFGGDLHEALCTNLAEKEVIGEVFEDRVENRYDLDLPPGLDGQEVIETLDDKFTGGGFLATCGHASVSYIDNSVSETELTLVVRGEPIVIDLQLQLVGLGEDGEFDPNDAALQEGFDALLGHGDATDGNCTEDSVPSDPETVSITLDATPTTLDEGSPVSVSGEVDVDGASSVLIVWGDGASSNVSISDGTYSASHTYTDDIGRGSSATYTIRASAGAASATERVTVNNVAPDITGASFRASTINEGDTATLDVTFTDPGDDTHTVDVAWSDGFSQSVEVSGGERSATLERTIADDNPTGTPSDTLSASVTVSDDDGGSDSASLVLTVNNVAPANVRIEPIEVLNGEETFDDEGNLVVNEGDVVRWRISFDDVGAWDSHTATIDWGDGTPVDGDVQVFGEGHVTRSFERIHTFADDPPTGTPDGSYDVTVTLTDDDTGTSTDTVTVNVNNVAPTLHGVAVSPDEHEENGADVTVSLGFSDPGLIDTHTVTIDWGAGWSSGDSDDTDATDEDRRLTVIDIPADPDAREGISATNRYGDDGVYTIVVTVVDDDTGTDVATRTLIVNSVDPTHAINDGAGDGAVTSPAGDQTFIGTPGEDVTISDSATDPGSDDLFFDWLFGDGAGVLNTYLVDVPAPGVDDPEHSPQVAPRDVTDEVSHAYADACLYGVSVRVTDDNGGDGGTDHVAVVVQSASADHDQRNFGQWRAAIQRGELAGDELDCYLDLAGYLSSVLVGASELAGEPWAPLAGTEDLTEFDRRGVPEVLTRNPGGPDVLRGEQIKLDRDLLAQWLNFAAGVWEWDTLVEDADGDGTLDTTFAEVMKEIEEVRTTSTSHHEVRDARQRLWQLGNPATPPGNGNPGNGGGPPGNGDGPGGGGPPGNRGGGPPGGGPPGRR